MLRYSYAPARRAISDLLRPLVLISAPLKDRRNRLRVTATMGDSRKKKRKFSEQEFEILFHEVTANINMLQGRNTLPSEKNAIWQTITSNINSLSSTQWEVEELKKKGSRY